MGKDSTYYADKNKKDRRTLEGLLLELPECFRELILFKNEQGAAISTQISYCYDLWVFVRYYLRREDTTETTIVDITYSTLDDIPKELFLEFIKYLEHGDEEEKHNETNKGIARKFAALKNLYKYHIAQGNINNNPLAMIIIKREKRKDHTIVRLTVKEVEDLLKATQKLTIFKRGRQRTYKKLTQKRDMAMFVLLLNTGLRISELVGLDLTDVDLRENCVNIVRKGGFTDKVYFNPAIKEILKSYIKNERKEIIETKVAKDSPVREAFFVSLQGKRWSVDSIERTVRQYCEKVIPHKHITPHKLRATYGSILYSTTGDIRLVSEVLGHENINTTIRYYAAMDDGRKKEAAKSVCLLAEKRGRKIKAKEQQSDDKTTQIDSEGINNTGSKTDVLYKRNTNNIIIFKGKYSE